VLRSARGGDILDGGEGNDNVQAGRGGDTVYGGTGNDLLVGGEGKDTYLFGYGDGTDTIRGIAKNDVLRLLASPLQLLLDRQGGDLVVRLYHSGDTLTLQNWFAKTPGPGELLKSADGSTLNSSKVAQLMQDMAVFSFAHGGITWEQSITDHPDEVQHILSRSWKE
jgi:Ca2+-binding RTX toxin-like protein